MHLYFRISAYRALVMSFRLLYGVQVGIFIKRCSNLKPKGPPKHLWTQILQQRFPRSSRMNELFKRREIVWRNEESGKETRGRSLNWFARKDGKLLLKFESSWKSNMAKDKRISNVICESTKIRFSYTRLDVVENKRYFRILHCKNHKSLNIQGGP